MAKKKSNPRKSNTGQTQTARSEAVEITLSRRKQLFFKILTILLPFLLLVATEIILRFDNYEGYPPFIKEFGNTASGEKLCIVEPTASKPYFFNNPDRPGYAEQTSFVMPKPANTLRIFLIGESAAKGYPQPRNLAMSSFLQTMLSDVMPNKKVEVINLGTTAISSFPITYMVKDALNYSPDLIISYIGNNEFFGAYGVASINSTGFFPPWMLPTLRWVNGLAIVQALRNFFGDEASEDRSLMEQMIGQSVIDSDDSMRKKASENLRYSLTQIANDAKSAGVPLLFCTTASNENGLAPLGEDNTGFLNETDKIKLNTLFNEGKNLISTNPESAKEKLLAALKLAPQHAGINFALGKTFAALGDDAQAGKFFLKAKNFDTMPWRPTEELEATTRAVANNFGIPLCDIAQSFRTLTNKSSDWELLDDHVHLSLRGQDETARLMLSSIQKLGGSFSLESSRLDTLANWESFAKRLGYNFYDEYRVNHTLSILFNIPFMKSSNNEAFNKFSNLVKSAEETMSPGVLSACREWQSNKPHAGGLRPITGMVARVMIRENRLTEALSLYQVAKNQVPDYTSWYLEYLYFELALTEQLYGSLNKKQRDDALSGIEQGNFLLKNGFSETGLTERYIGRLYQLRGEWENAIPFLLAAQPKMTNEDLVAVNHALIMSYVKIGEKQTAMELINVGIQFGGKFSETYKNILSSLKQNNLL